jgi:hypothetical protein
MRISPNLNSYPKVASRQFIKSKVHVVAGDNIGLSFTQKVHVKKN